MNHRLTNLTLAQYGAYINSLLVLFLSISVSSSARRYQDCQFGTNYFEDADFNTRIRGEILVSI